jgi:hypothetical protein
MNLKIYVSVKDRRFFLILLGVKKIEYGLRFGEKGNQTLNECNKNGLSYVDDKRAVYGDGH